MISQITEKDKANLASLFYEDGWEALELSEMFHITKVETHYIIRKYRRLYE